MKNKVLYISYNIDTEGPLTETISASFKRIQESFGLKIKPSKKNLKKIQQGKYKIKSYFIKKKIKEFVDKKRITTLNNWSRIFKQTELLNTKKFNNKFVDSYQQPMVFSWFFLTHAGFTGINPRKRTLGFNKVYLKYNLILKKIFKKKFNARNQFGWHFHAHSITNDAHRASTTYLNSSHIYDVLSHYVIDTLWFPSMFRAGHNSIRQDLNYFLEEWIPYDFSNTSYIKVKKLDGISSTARFGNWSKAPTNWLPYNPDFYDYQKKGKMKRYIFRTLPIKEREYQINLKDIKKGFEDAAFNGKAMISVTNHDFRDILSDLDYFYKLLMQAKKRFPKVKIKFTGALDGAREVINMKSKRDYKLGLNLKILKNGKYYKLYVKCKNIFGTQPFLAIKTKKKKYYWQNFDCEGKNLWSYSFDPYNLLLKDVDQIGVAASNKFGKVEVCNLNTKNFKIIKNQIN